MDSYHRVEERLPEAGVTEGRRERVAEVQTSTFKVCAERPDIQLMTRAADTLTKVHVGTKKVKEGTGGESLAKGRPVWWHLQKSEVSSCGREVLPALELRTASAASNRAHTGSACGLCFLKVCVPQKWNALPLLVMAPSLIPREPKVAAGALLGVCGACLGWGVAGWNPPGKALSDVRTCDLGIL